MTILDATEKLLDWYDKNDYFEEKDISKIILVSDTPEKDKAAFKCALKDMEDGGLVCKAEIDGNRNIWTLKRKLDSFNQSVDIPRTIAVEISTVLNKACVALGDYHDQCDPNNINIKDLCNLVFICRAGMNQSNQEQSSTSVEDILLPPTPNDEEINGFDFGDEGEEEKN